MSNLRLPSIALLLTLLLSGCSSQPTQTPDAGDYPTPLFPASRMLPADNSRPAEVYDPWRAMNIRTYNFNYHFDQKVFLPVVRGYRAVLPKVARQGVANWFSNFRDMGTMVNALLQLNPEKFFQATGRVVLNSTVGLGGFIDVATMAEVPQPREDFGQTLGYWGVDQGPYLVIPFLGPSNLRDGAGLIPDLYVQTLVQDELLSKPVRFTAFTFDAIDTRHGTSFRYYETGSAFEYELVRWLWSTKRELDIAQ